MLFSVTMGKMHAKMPKYALDIFIGSPTGLLKSSNFQCRLPIQTFVTLYFYFEQIQFADLTLRPGCFRVAERFGTPNLFMNRFDGLNPFALSHLKSFKYAMLSSGNET